MSVFYRFSFILIFLILILIFLVHYWIVGQATYGDGIFYYAYTRSIYFDHDIDFSNEFSHDYLYENNNSVQGEEKVNAFGELSRTKLRENRFFIGGPILWLIPFTVADLLSRSLNLFGFEVATNGYSNIYQISIGVFNVLLVVIGSFLFFRFLSSFFSSFISFLTVATFLFGSNLLYYGSIDVINSHPASFFASTTFLIYWWRTYGKRGYRRYFLLGFFVGLLGLIRTQDFIYGVVILVEHFNIFKKMNPYSFKLIVFSFFLHSHEKKIYREKYIMLTKYYFPRFLAMGFFVFVTFFPQMVVWKILNGSYFLSSYYQHFTIRPYFIEVLFAFKTGIITWTPIVLFSLAGFYWLRKIKKMHLLIVCGIIVFVIQYGVVSFWGGWWQGESYGNRMIISVFPYLTIGLSGFLKYIKNFSKRGIFLFCVFLVGFNCLMILYFLLVLQHPTYNSEGVDTQSAGFERIRSFFEIK